VSVRSRSWPVSVKDPGLGTESCQLKDPSYRPRRIHQHDRVATPGLSPDKAMDGARIQEGQLSQVQDDGLSRNHDPVDLVLKILNSGHVELASKQKISSWHDLDVKGTEGFGGHRALPESNGVERATG
jgi:hypothetical protein